MISVGSAESTFRPLPRVLEKNAMRRMLFINLPVTDLPAATDFYTGLGFDLNPDFSSAECSCIVVSDTIFVMLLVRERFADFTAGPVGDARTATTVINCLSAVSRARSTSWSPGR